MDLTEVLFIAYYFPPVGGAGVQRSLKFARYLPEEGFLPVVVAGPEPRRSRWEPEDPELAAELPDTVPVYRPPGAPPEQSPRQLRWARWTGRSAPHQAWWRRAVLETGRRAARAHSPALVYVSLSPFEGLSSALRLGRELGVPVVADLRDPWALDEVRVYPTSWARRRAARAMRRELRAADQVLLNTPEAARAVREAFPDLPAERLGVLANGYDASDFCGLAPRAPDGRFRIVHTGYLHTQLALAQRRRPAWKRALGGELWPVDFFGRSHFYLLQALEALAREGAGDLPPLELELIGALTDADRQLIERSSVASSVRAPGYADHRRTVAAQVAADLLFLPMHGLPPGRRARIVPAKTYEYLASGRPILAAVPQGDARDLVVGAGAGRAVEPDDVPGMARAIAELARAGPAPAREPAAVVRRFERRQLTRELAECFRSALHSA